MPDLLEKIWLEVINVDPAGKWIERSSKKPGAVEKYYSKCTPALHRMKNLGSAEDIGRISRFVRYDACFGILYSLDDPGLPKGTSLRPAPLIEAALSGKKLNKKLSKFVKSLREILSVEDDGEWLLDLRDDKNEWANEVGAAVKRLRKAGPLVSDFAQLAIWSRYEACESTLRLLHEADLDVPDDTRGLCESLLGADPSGKEGGPGSWPMPSSKTKSKAVSSDGKERLWRIRSGQAIAFSPDSKTLAVGGASGPTRLHDALTGKEQIICRGIKAHIYRLAFSPDGRRLAVADIDKRLDICDTRTGKVLAKTTFPEDEISGLEYSSKTGELLRSSWADKIDVIDPATAKKKEPLSPSSNTNAVDALHFFPGGDKLIAAWKDNECRSHITIWSWPGRKPLANFDVAYHSLANVALSPDGRLIAISQQKAFDNATPGILLLDAVTGEKFRKVPVNEPDALTFLPDGRLIVSDGEKLRFFEPNKWKQTSVIEGGDEANEIAVSPNGELLAITSSGGVYVWQL